MARHEGDDEARSLSAAAAAGDSRAMWHYALLLIGLADAYSSFPGNALPFLKRVADTITTDGNQQAYGLISHAAAAGYAPAMVVQATWLVNTERERAIELLDQAASQGHAPAMLDLGMLLTTDEPEQAEAWLGRLAGQGDDMGMYALSRLLRIDNPQAAKDWLHKAAAAGNVHAQSDLGVLAAEHGESPDPRHPPAVDPRATGVLAPNTPVSRQARQVADCLRCGGKTVQDIYEFITGHWFGLRGPSTAGKTGTRLHFSACTVCGYLYPVDEPARQYAAAKGGQFFRPPSR